MARGETADGALDVLCLDALASEPGLAGFSDAWFASESGTGASGPGGALAAEVPDSPVADPRAFAGADPGPASVPAVSAGSGALVDGPRRPSGSGPEPLDGGQGCTKISLNKGQSAPGAPGFACARAANRARPS